MPVLAEIDSLENRISQLLNSVSEPAESSRRFRQLVTEAIIELLDRHTPAELRSANLEASIRESLERIYPGWRDEFYTEIAEHITELVKRTDTFYTARGIDTTGLREAVAKSDLVNRLTEALEVGMRTVNDELREQTVEIVQDAVLKGKISSKEIALQVEEQADTTAYRARLQTQAALSAYNQTYRNQLAENAELEYFFYHGTIVRNSRAFCRIHINRVFSGAQIAQMDNGMLNPVQTHRGGWRCIHNWLPVDLEWDEELKSKLVTATVPTVIKMDPLGRRTITVFADGPRLERLEAQIPMERQGYEQFLDSDKDPRGFVAVHESWFERLGHDRRTKEYKEMIRAREIAQQLADEGHRVELNIKGTGDFIVDGRPRWLSEF